MIHLKCYQEIERLRRQLLGAQKIVAAEKAGGFPKNDPELFPPLYDLSSGYWENLDLDSDDPVGHKAPHLLFQSLWHQW